MAAPAMVRSVFVIIIAPIRRVETPAGACRRWCRNVAATDAFRSRRRHQPPRSTDGLMAAGNDDMAAPVGPMPGPERAIPEFGLAGRVAALRIQRIPGLA